MLYIYTKTAVVTELFTVFFKFVFFILFFILFAENKYFDAAARWC